MMIYTHPASLATKCIKPDKSVNGDLSDRPVMDFDTRKQCGNGFLDC